MGSSDRTPEEKQLGDKWQYRVQVYSLGSQVHSLSGFNSKSI